MHESWLSTLVITKTNFSIAPYYGTSLLHNVFIASTKYFSNTKWHILNAGGIRTKVPKLNYVIHSITPYQARFLHICIFLNIFQTRILRILAAAKKSNKIYKMSSSSKIPKIVSDDNEVKKDDFMEVAYLESQNSNDPRTQVTKAYK